MVSVCCVTFNQARYIAQALYGIERQEYDGDIELLIHDDASSDGTSNIVAQFVSEYRGVVKYIRQERNMYSQGYDPFAALFSIANGDYMALCEGDDYWHSPQKIATQVEMLEQRPEIDICTHRSDILDDFAGEFERRIAESDEMGSFTAADAIVKGAVPNAQTASIMIRRGAALAFAKFADSCDWLPISDKFIKFFGARRGGGVSLPDYMAVYRRRAAGSWTNQQRDDPRARFMGRMAKMRALNQLLDLANPTEGDAIRAARNIEARELLLDRETLRGERLRGLAAALHRASPRESVSLCKAFFRGL